MYSDRKQERYEAGPCCFISAGIARNHTRKPCSNCPLLVSGCTRRLMMAEQEPAPASQRTDLQPQPLRSVHRLQSFDRSRNGPSLSSALSSADRQDSSSFWMHELSYSSLESTDSGYTQQPWLPDELCTNCMHCQRPFDLWRWTHHCRDCGGLFCHECSSHRVPSSARDGPATLRVCDRCAFSAAYPEHLGCDNPFACKRCSLPRWRRRLWWESRRSRDQQSGW